MCAKHFPGHGATLLDSHGEFAIVLDGSAVVPDGSAVVPDGSAVVTERDLAAVRSHVTPAPAVHFVYVPTTLGAGLSYFVVRRIYKVVASD